MLAFMDEKESSSGLADGYIHGFARTEQDRLFMQARVNEDIIFSQVDFSSARKIVEIGSGVGAQTIILHERYPNAHIDCVDASAEQLERARKTLGPLIQNGTVTLQQADALHLPFEGDTYDGAYISWLLEHVQDPVGILEEARRVLKVNGVLYVNEVLNSTFYVHPYSPAILKYWFEFNDYQWSLKGDPFVGGKLANYLIKAGYQNITTQVLTHQYDNRTPKKRSAFIDFWTGLLKSGAEGLIKAGRVDDALVQEMTRELQALKTAPDSVIFFAWILARGEAL